MSAPKFAVTFTSAKVVNLETGEEHTFTSLAEVQADAIAGEGLAAVDDALEAAGGTAMEEPQ